MTGSPATPSRPPLGTGAILALLILLALVIRIAAVEARPMIEMDEASYVRMAENLSAGQPPLEMTGTDTTNFSPILPLMTAGMAAVTSDHVLAAYIVSIVFGSLLLVPAFLLGKEFAGNRAGLMAAGLAAVLPIFVDYSSQIYSESVFIFFLLLSVVFTRHMLSGCRIPCSTLAGAAAGLAYLANPSTLMYLVLFFVLAVAVSLRRGIMLQMTRAVLVLLFMFSIYAVPYVLFLHSELGEWSYNGKAAGNSYAASRGLRHNTVEWEREMLSLTPDSRELTLNTLDDSADPAGNLWRDPGRSLQNLARQARFFFTGEAGRVLPLWLVPLLGLGLFSRAWTRRRAAANGYLLLMMAPLLLVLTVYNAYTRLFMPVAGIALVWLSQGWEKLEEWGGRPFGQGLEEPPGRRRQTALRWLLGAAVILPLLAASAVTVLDRDYSEGHRDAGRSLAAASAESGDPVTRETPVMSRESSSVFYAGGRHVWLPYAGYAQMNEYAQSQDVAYLIVSRRDIEQWRPELAPLLGPDAGHPQWRLAGTVRAGSDEETYIFAATE